MLTELLDKMSVFEGGESSGPRRKGLEGQSSPRVGSAGPGVPAASADPAAWAGGDRAASHISRRTQSSALERQRRVCSRPAQMWKKIHTKC